MLQSKTRQIVFKPEDRVICLSTNRKGTITKLFTDLAMVRWDGSTYHTPDPVHYGTIVHVPHGWDEID